MPLRHLAAGGACVLAAVCVGVPLASGSTTTKAAATAPSGTPIYLDRSYSYAERAADLVSRMTTAEKASQTISSAAPAIPRLGIRQYGQWNEALHGVSRSQLANNGNATVLQQHDVVPDRPDDGLQLGPGPALPGRAADRRRGARGLARQHAQPRVLFADDEPRARPALGPQRRDLRRGPVPHRGDGLPVRRRHGGQGRAAASSCPRPAATTRR